MTCATAAFPRTSPFDCRGFTLGNRLRAISGGVIIGLGAAAAACVTAAIVSVAAVWMVAASLSTNPYIHAGSSIGPEMIAPGYRYPAVAAVAAVAVVADLSDLAPAVDDRGDAPDTVPEPEVAPATTPTSAPVGAVPPLTSGPERQIYVPAPARNDSSSLPGPERRTAIYDIAAHTVYLPDGEELEAHSGVGRRLDDPRYVSEKNRGPTPPNVYDLALRGELFHGVRAIRLNPVGEANMFGRDGMLAHTYMLGPTGQSFGCVSFKNYPAFLRAFLKGEVDRLVIVPHLDATAARSILSRHRHGDRYASVHR
ncbi:MAG: tlde1 domain-containing protein [Xanthobacteraceae bacterium]